LSEADSGAAALETQIYEAAVLPELWPGLLDRLGHVAGGVGAVAFGVVDATARWTSSPAIAEAMKTFVEEGWHARNCRMTAGFARGLATYPGFVGEAEMFTDRGFLDEPIYRDFFIPNGLGWHAGTIITIPDGDRLVLSVERAFAAGPVPEAAIRVLNGARPHLARAAMLGARLAFERTRTAVETLETLGLPACALSAGGRVLLANDLFDAETDFWTTRGGDRLAIREQRASRLVEEALGGIAMPNGVRSLPLVEQGGGRVAVFHLVPVRRAAHDLFSGAAAIGVLTRPSQGGQSGANLLQALFDLTPAEADVAGRIAAGEAVGGIAGAGGRSVETIRGHLKNVLAKTGTRRQAELAALLSSLMFPFHEP